MNHTYNFNHNPSLVPKVHTPNRIIDGSIPTVGTNDILLTLLCYESCSMHGQMPIIWDKAEGHSVYDISGNKWIDFTSTIFVTNTGHANKKVVKRLHEQLDKSLLHSYTYATKIRAEYVKKLIEFAGPPFEKCFLVSAGTEAVEAGLKLMRLHGQKIGKRKGGIVCIEGNFHGRTMGAYMMSNKQQDKDWIGAYDPNIHHIKFPYPWKLNEKDSYNFLQKEIEKLSNCINIKTDICGFVLETYQGWGAIFYPNEFVKGIKQLCNENNILLTFDEMQAGFARTGKRFGYEHYEVIPDMICCGKGMGSGFPISGVLSSKKIMDLTKVGEMSSTHSANPLACAAGLATLEVIEEENLITEAHKKGKVFHDKLNDIKNKYPSIISHICGRGMVAALIFNNYHGSLFASKLAEKCLGKGVLVVHTGRESIKLAPPLTITYDALIEGLDVIESAIKELI